MVTTGETVDLAEWIIDDTCLVFFADQKIQVQLDPSLIYANPPVGVAGAHFCAEKFPSGN